MAVNMVATTTTPIQTSPSPAEPDEIMKFYEKLGMTYTLCILAGLVVICFLFGMFSHYVCCRRSSSTRRFDDSRNRETRKRAVDPDDMGVGVVGQKPSSEAGITDPYDRTRHLSRRMDDFSVAVV